jgi:hypothetical protein
MWYKEIHEPIRKPMKWVGHERRCIMNQKKREKKHAIKRRTKNSKMDA